MSREHSPAEPPRFRVVTIGPNLFGADDDFHVHAADCTDPRRNPHYRYHHDDVTHPHNVASLRDLVHTIYDPDDFGYDPDQWTDYTAGIKVFPCIDLPDEH